jgi:hypothetical protein
MNKKSKGIGLGITLGAALGVVLGILAGHVALWLGIGIAIGIAIGSTLRRTTCARCEAAKRNRELEARSLVKEKGVYHGITRACFHIGSSQPQRPDR